MHKRLPNDIGLGFRSPHAQDVLTGEHQITWFEVMTDNYLAVGGEFAYHLSSLSERYPITFHCVGMSLGSLDTLNVDYFAALKRLADTHQPLAISDHLSWSNLGGRHSHDLLPLPYTQEALIHCVERVEQIQELLNRQLLLENISMYFQHSESDIDEAMFFNELCAKTGCGIIFDINNLYVNQKNLGWDSEQYIQTLNFDHVQQFHIAGHENHDSVLIDTHGSPVAQQVLDLFADVIQRYGAKPTLLEWDNNLPSFVDLNQQGIKVSQYLDSATLFQEQSVV